MPDFQEAVKLSGSSLSDTFEQFIQKRTDYREELWGPMKQWPNQVAPPSDESAVNRFQVIEALGMDHTLYPIPSYGLRDEWLVPYRSTRDYQDMLRRGVEPLKSLPAPDRTEADDFTSYWLAQEIYIWNGSRSPKEVHPSLLRAYVRSENIGQLARELLLRQPELADGLQPFMVLLGARLYEIGIGLVPEAIHWEANTISQDSMNRVIVNGLEALESWKYEHGNIENNGKVVIENGIDRVISSSDKGPLHIPSEVEAIVFSRYRYDGKMFPSPVFIQLVQACAELVRLVENGGNGSNQSLTDALTDLQKLPRWNEFDEDLRMQITNVLPDVAKTWRYVKSKDLAWMTGVERFVKATLLDNRETSMDLRARLSELTDYEIWRIHGRAFANARRIYYSYLMDLEQNGSLITDQLRRLRRSDNIARILISWFLEDKNFFQEYGIENVVQLEDLIFGVLVADIHDVAGVNLSVRPLAAKYIQHYKTFDSNNFQPESNEYKIGNIARMIAFLGGRYVNENSELIPVISIFWDAFLADIRGHVDEKVFASFRRIADQVTERMGIQIRVHTGNLKSSKILYNASLH